MRDSENMMLELRRNMDQHGLPNVVPEVLSDTGNLIVRLHPYPIVARIAKLFDGDDPYFWKQVWLQEIKIVEHLLSHHVPVVPYTSLVPPGPHKLCGTWMTLWDYVTPAYLPPLDERRAIDMLNEMGMVISSYEGQLQSLGAWKNVAQAAANLKRQEDKNEHVLTLLKEYEEVNLAIKQKKLYPAHGDAHPNNLIPSAKGWLWIDFEDVSLMPKFWDIASFIGNTVLFEGLNHSTVDYVIKLKNVASDKKSLQFALKARIVMSITMNLSLALDGNGDLDFAFSQLERFQKFLYIVENEI